MIGVRFEHPTYEQAVYYTRELARNERFSYGRMFAHTGLADMACYRMGELVEGFDRGADKGSEFLASRNLLVGIESLVKWCRDIIGDEELAGAIDTRVERDEPLGAQIDTVIALVKARYKQYCEVLERDGREPLGGEV